MKKILLLIFLAMLFAMEMYARDWYVKPAGSATADGLTWETAVDLQTAFEKADAGDTFYMSAGTHKPNRYPRAYKGNNGTVNTYVTKYYGFVLKQGVVIQGGYPDGLTGTAKPDRGTDITANQTIISGRYSNLNWQRSYHVMIGLGDMTGTKLDRLYIKDGFGYAGSGSKTGKGRYLDVAANTEYLVPNLSGGGLYLESDSPTTLTLKDVYIQNNNVSGETPTNNAVTSGTDNSKGAGIYARNVSLKLEGSIQLNNNNAIYHGGGIYMAGKATIFTEDMNSVLICQNNFSGRGYGGGICIEDTDPDYVAKVVLNELRLIQNNKIDNATVGVADFSNGGGFYFKGDGTNPSTFKAEKVTAAGNLSMKSGGGLYFENISEVIVTEDLILRENKTTAGAGVSDIRGAGMFTQNADLLQLNNIDITDNVFANYSGTSGLEGNGGGLYNHSIKKFTVSGTMLVAGNRARDNGGGIYNYNVEDIIIPKLILGEKNGSTYRGNTAARRNGGGIYIEEVKNLTVETVELYGNTADINGGGMFLKGTPGVTTLDAKSLIAENNTTGRHGGGLYTNLIQNIEITGLTLNNNKADGGNGGGICSEEVKSLIAETAVLRGNTAGAKTNSDIGGGGIFLKGTQGAAALAVESLTAENNISGRHGGAVYTDLIQNITITNLTLNSNKASNGSGGGFYPKAASGNTASFIVTNLLSCVANEAGASGGAFYNDYLDPFQIVNPVADKTVISGNRAGSSGGFANNNNTVFRMPNLPAQNNTAGQNGGTIANFDNTDFEVTNEINLSVSTAGSGSGGGIYSSAIKRFFALPVITIDQGSAGYSGGGLYFERINDFPDFSNAVLTITNSSAKQQGGGIYLSGNNKDGVNWSNNLKVGTLVLTGNSAVHEGGGLYTTGTDKIEIGRLTLERNKSTNGTRGNGGGIYTAGTSARRVSLLHIDKLVSCDGNEAGSSGGAFYNNYVTEVRFADANPVVMKNNKAGNNGGAVYNTNLPRFYVKDLTLTDNTAGSNGGALFNESIAADVVLSKAAFNNNAAGTNGGAVYNNKIYGYILIDDFTLNNNKAGVSASGGHGGGLYCQAVSGNITINKISAELNTAGINLSSTAAYNGGTFFFSGNSSKEITIRNGLIKRGEARGHGGAVYFRPSGTPTHFSMHSIELDACRTRGGSIDATNGGVIYFENPASTSNTIGKTNVTLTDINMHDCIANWDGGIFFGESVKNITITTDKLPNNSFTRNRAARNAPGLYLQRPKGEVLIENSIFEGHLGGDVTGNSGIGSTTETSTGGALYSRHVRRGMLRNCQFIDNHVNDGGAAGYSEGSKWTYMNLLFDGNTTRVGGGGALFECALAGAGVGENMEAYAKNIVFRNNAAGSKAGALYVTMGTIELVNVVFSNNEAKHAGGAIHTDNPGSSIRLYNTHFLGNQAPVGGAVYANVGSRNHLFVNCQFTGNTANTKPYYTAAWRGGGSAVFFEMSNSARSTFVNCTFADNYSQANVLTRYQGSAVNVGAANTEGGYFYNCIFYNNQNAAGTVSDFYAYGNGSNPMQLIDCHFTSSTSYKGNASGSAAAYTKVVNPTYGDPLFLRPLKLSTATQGVYPNTGGDYHLTTGSPCIDSGADEHYLNKGYNYNLGGKAGTWAGIISQVDLDISTRIQGLRIDKGVYEGDGYAGNFWVGSADTDPGNDPSGINYGKYWNKPGNWLNNRVPAAGEDIIFHSTLAVNDLLVPELYNGGAATWDEGDKPAGTPVDTMVVGNIVNQNINGYGLVLDGRKLAVEGAIEFRTASGNYIDARKDSSYLILKGSDNVNQDIPNRLLVDNTACNLTIDRTADIKVDHLRILDSLEVCSSGRINAKEFGTKISYGMYPVTEETANGYEQGRMEDIAAQTIVNGQYRDETIYNLVIDNGKGVTIENGISSDAADDMLAVSSELIVNADKRMIIAPKAGVKVEGLAFNYAGADGILIKTGVSQINDTLRQTAPTGTFIFKNGENSQVKGTVEFYSKAYYNASGSPGYKYKWQYFTIPVRRQTLADFNGSFIRVWNEKNDHLERDGTAQPGAKGTPYWNQLLSAASELYSTEGYEITHTKPKVISIKGTLENRDLERILTYTDYEAVHSDEFKESWKSAQLFSENGHQVLGSPYTAAIDISKIGFGSNLDKTVYIFHTGSWEDWKDQNNGSGTDAQNHKEGGYMAVPQSTVETLSAFRYLPSMQGFVVKRLNDGGTDAENTLTLNYNSLVSKNQQALRSGRSKGPLPYMTIDLLGSSTTDRLWILINPDCSKGFNNGWDGRKAPEASEAAQLFTMEADGEREETFQVSTMDNIDETYIGIKPGKDTEYTLRFNYHNGMDVSSRLYLNDLKTGMVVDITGAGAEYTFTASAEEAVSRRFKITKEKVTTSLGNPPDEWIEAYTSGNQVLVENKSGEQAAVSLYDASGRCLHTQVLPAYTTSPVSKELIRGVYIIRAVSNGEKTTKSIIL